MEMKSEGKGFTRRTFNKGATGAVAMASVLGLSKVKAMEQPIPTSVTLNKDQLLEAYRKMLIDRMPEDLRHKATYYLSRVRRMDAMYEGVLPVSGNTLRKKTKKVRIGKEHIIRFYTLIKHHYDNNFGKYRFDNHYRGSFYPVWFYNA